MPAYPYGTAPRRISSGQWVTRKGRQLTASGSAYWEHRYRTGSTDGHGHIVKPSVVQQKPKVSKVGPSGNLTMPSAKVKNPGFSTTYAAKHGDQSAIAKVKLYNKSQQAGKDARAFVAAATDQRLHTGPGSAAARASKVASPIATSIIKSMSPTTSLMDAAHEARHLNIPAAAVSVASIVPAGKGFKLAKATEDAVKAEKAARGGEEAVQQILGSAGSAKKAYAEQKVLRSAERGKRFAASAKAFNEAGRGVAGHEASLAKLSGELPKVHFANLTHFDASTMDKLMNLVEDHPGLLQGEKTSLRHALKKVHAGYVPTPSEVRLFEKAWGPEKAGELVAPFGKKATHLLSEVVNFPRSVMASFDVSAPFRQGLIAFAHNPKVAGKNMGPMFKYMFSDKSYQALHQAIEQDPHFEHALDAGLSFTGLGDVGHREEMFASNLAEKLTGGKYSFVRASSRAYVGFLNKTRMDLFKNLTDEASKIVPLTPEREKEIANFVNVATGRGRLGPLEKAAVPLNTIFFAPRLFASRLQAFNLALNPTVDPFVRKKAAMALVKLVGVGSTFIALAAMAGAKVATDPRNPDWGKIRFGNTRLDLWGGFQQPARAIAQISSGVAISSTTGKRLSLTAGGFGDTTRWDIAERFGVGKLAPTPSLVHDKLTGKDFQGNPFSWKTELLSRGWPLLLQDVRDIARDTHSPWAAAAGFGIGAFGVGIQNYKAPKAKGKKSVGLDPFSGSGEDPFANLGSIDVGGSGEDPFKNLRR